MSFLAIWTFLKESWLGKLLAVVLAIGAMWGLKAVYDGRKREEGRKEVKEQVKVEAEKAQTKMEKAKEEYRVEGGAQSALEQGKF